MSTYCNEKLIVMTIALGCLVMMGCSGSLRKPELYHLKWGKEYNSYRATPNKGVKQAGGKSFPSIEILNLDQCITLALQHNPDLKQSAWEIETAIVNVKQSGQWSNPELEIEAENIEESAYRFSLTLPVDVSGKKNTRREIGKVEVEQAQLAYHQVRLNVINKVTHLYYELQALQEKIIILQEAITLTEQIVKLSQKRHAAGAGTKVDVIYAKIDFERANLRYQNTESNYHVGKHELAGFWGRASHQFSEVANIESVPTKLIGEKNILQHINFMPEIKQAELEKQKKDTLKSAGWKKLFSDFNLIGINAQDFSRNEQYWGVALGLDLPLFNQKTNEQSALTIYAKQSELNLKTQVVEATQKVRRLYNNLNDYYRETVSYETKILPALKNAYDESVQFYKNGKLPLIELIRLKNEWLQEKLSHIEKIREYHGALSDLEKVLGRSWNEINEVKK